MGLFKRFTKPSKKEAEEHDFNHLIDILLHDESVEKRYDAAVRLGSLHDARAVPALIQAFGDGGSIHIKGVAVVYVSVAAVEALGEIGGPEATQVLSKVLRVKALVVCHSQQRKHSKSSVPQTYSENMLHFLISLGRP